MIFPCWSLQVTDKNVEERYALLETGKNENIFLSLGQPSQEKPGFLTTELKTERSGFCPLISKRRDVLLIKVLANTHLYGSFPAPAISSKVCLSSFFVGIRRCGHATRVRHFLSSDWLSRVLQHSCCAYHIPEPS